MRPQWSPASSAGSTPLVVGGGRARCLCAAMEPGLVGREHLLSGWTGDAFRSGAAMEPGLVGREHPRFVVDRARRRALPPQWSPASSAGSTVAQLGRRPSRCANSPQWSPASSAGSTGGDPPVAEQRLAAPAAMEPGLVGREHSAPIDTMLRRRPRRNGARPRRPGARPASMSIVAVVHVPAAMEPGLVGREHRHTTSRSLPPPARLKPQWSPASSAGSTASTVQESRRSCVARAAMEPGLVGREHCIPMRLGRPGRTGDAAMEPGLVGREHRARCEWRGGRRSHARRNGARPRRPGARRACATSRRSSGSCRNGARPRRPGARRMLLPLTPSAAHRWPQWSPASSAGSTKRTLSASETALHAPQWSPASSAGSTDARSHGTQYLQFILGAAMEPGLVGREHPSSHLATGRTR